MEDCAICCNEMKKKCTCSMCKFSACYKCFSKFILDGTVHPKCMNCDKPWTRKNLVESFGQYFVTNKYKTKRENILFDLEKALLPDTQHYAVRAKKIRELNVLEEKKRKQIQDFVDQIFPIPTNLPEEEFDKCLENRKDIRMKINNLNEDIANIQYKKSFFNVQKGKSTERLNYFIKCSTEDCKGYISTRMKCEMCSTKICKDCHAQLKTDDPHECNKDDVETVKMLMTNTKNCPSCKSLIYKIDGCDQMFCTQCNTAFSWKTGEVIYGRIHNPHYYEYMRRNGSAQREVGDIPCGGIPHLGTIMNIFGRGCSKLYEIHRLCNHIQFVELVTYNTDFVRDNLDLRIDYLNNWTTLEIMKHELQKREKAINKKREISNILNTFLVVCADIYRRCIEDKTEHLGEFESIKNYTNELLIEVSWVFGCVVPWIDNFWYIEKRKYHKTKDGQVLLV